MLPAGTRPNRLVRFSSGVTGGMTSHRVHVLSVITCGLDAAYGSSVEFMLGSRDLLQNPWTSILRFLALYAPLLPLSLPFVLDVIYLLQVMRENAAHALGR